MKEGRTESSFIAYFASITYYYAIVAVSRPIEPGSTAQKTSIRLVHSRLEYVMYLIYLLPIPPPPDGLLDS